MRRVGEALEGIIKDGSPKQAALKDVFRLNHEIGRMARESPSLAPALREMQLEINYVTIHIKRNELDAARDGFERVAAALGKVRAARAMASSDPHRALIRDL